MDLLEITVLFSLFLTVSIISISKIFRQISRIKLMVLAVGLFPVAAVIIWFFGIIWINSSYCTDWNSCDSGGMLALTIDVIVLTVLSFVISVPVSFCVTWIVKLPWPTIPKS